MLHSHSIKNCSAEYMPRWSLFRVDNLHQLGAISLESICLLCPSVIAIWSVLPWQLRLHIECTAKDLPPAIRHCPLRVPNKKCCFPLMQRGVNRNMNINLDPVWFRFHPYNMCLPRLHPPFRRGSIYQHRLKKKPPTLDKSARTIGCTPLNFTLPK